MSDVQLTDQETLSLSGKGTKDDWLAVGKSLFQKGLAGMDPLVEVGSPYKFRLNEAGKTLARSLREPQSCGGMIA